MTLETYEISEILHNIKCNANHTDSCFWFYFSGDPTRYDIDNKLNRYEARYKYGQLARIMLETTDFHTLKRILWPLVNENFKHNHE